MKPLTAWADASVDASVHQMLQRIVTEVTGQMRGDLQAIVLGGGFGRGEGGVLRRPDGTVHVVNDFDLELIYREPWGRLASKLKVHFAHRRQLARLAERLAREFDMKQVDLSLRGLGSMDVPTPKLADYDLRHGHLLLWGDADPCDVMRPFRADEIPAFEGTWLLRNRAIGLVLARLYLDLTGALRPEHVENFYIELNKSALAMGDALWILSGRYDVSYATRKAGFKDLARLGYPAFDALSRLYDQAAEYKLRPVEGQYPGQSPQSLWLTLAQAHVDFFCWHESRRLGQSIASPAQWQAWADGQTHDGSGNALRRWADRHLGASGQCPALMAPLRQDRLGSVACALGLLAARGERTREGWQALARWRGADCPGDPAAAWRHLARGLLSALHPGGEVGRFLASTQDSP